MKTESQASALESQITAAILSTNGQRVVSGGSYFKRDLGFASIDLIDFFFELERLLGRRLNARAFLLSRHASGEKGGDFCVDEVIAYVSDPKLLP